MASHYLPCSVAVFAAVDLWCSEQCDATCCAVVESVSSLLRLTSYRYLPLNFKKEKFKFFSKFRIKQTDYHIRDRNLIFFGLRTIRQFGLYIFGLGGMCLCFHFWFCPLGILHYSTSQKVTSPEAPVGTDVSGFKTELNGSFCWGFCQILVQETLLSPIIGKNSNSDPTTKTSR